MVDDNKIKEIIGTLRNVFVAHIQRYNCSNEEASKIIIDTFKDYIRLYINNTFPGHSNIEVVKSAIALMLSQFRENLNHAISNKEYFDSICNDLIENKKQENKDG